MLISVGIFIALMTVTAAVVGRRSIVTTT
ncbi:hypothetical protein A2U01_0087247, partial [Trifolium medium]|nr:hypothetical protein [Trifolium medium]